MFRLRGSRTEANPGRGRSGSSGWRRWLGALGLLLGSVLALEGAARWGIALAITLAPNALSTQPAPPFGLPPELASRGAQRLETHVGPPVATLASWLIEPSRQPARGSIVLLHGVRQDRRSLSALGAAFSDAGYRSILIDLRGHGESSGRYLTYGSLEPHDISAVLDDVATRVAARGHALGPVGAFGFSYGAAVALDLGARDARVCAVVAAAPFSSLREVLGDYRKKYLPAALNLLPDSWFEGALHDAAWLASFDLESASPLHWVQQSRARQLLLHGTADTQVPLRHSVALSGVAGPRAVLHSIPGAEHYDLPPDVLRREALGWFERWLAAPDCAR